MNRNQIEKRIEKRVEKVKIINAGENSKKSAVWYARIPVFIEKPKHLNRYIAACMYNKCLISSK